MSSFALIVFREVLEIALVLSILMLATRGVTARLRWIFGGLAAGIIGSMCVAACTERISEFADGMGTELFNSIVLFASAALVGVTIVWMSHTGKNIARDLRAIGGEVRAGTKPLSVLAIIVGLSTLREGSEVALLFHGVLASGESLTSILAGGLIGLAAGVGVGLALYYGLLGAATKHIFRVSNTLLIFVAAGMVAQGVGFLSAADVLGLSSAPVWNSSWIVDERGIVGQTLHVLIGYTARPTAAQILAYAGTCGLLLAALALLKRIERRQSAAAARPLAASLAIVFLFLNCAAEARAIDKIYSPILEEGEIEIETRGRWSSDHREEKDGEFKGVFAAGYTPLSWYGFEVYGIVKKPGDDSAEFDAVELENKFQPFEQGEYFLDLGFHADVEYEVEDNNYAFEGTVLLEKDLGRFVNVLNVTAEYEDIGGENEVEPSLAYRTNYLLMPELQPGFEWHSEFNELEEMGSFHDQSHALGPSIYGKYSRVRYELAYVLGISDDAPDRTWRWTVEFEF